MPAVFWKIWSFTCFPLKYHCTACETAQKTNIFVTKKGGRASPTIHASASGPSNSGDCKAATKSCAKIAGINVYANKEPKYT